MIIEHRKKIIVLFAFLSLIATFFLFQLKVSFAFEQFFPQGDEDLQFFRDFTEEFETDDNFLLVALESDETVWDSTFLTQLHKTALDLRKAPYVVNVQSLTTMKYPVKTPFGYSTLPILNIRKPERYTTDSLRVMKDDRFINSLISANSKSMAIVMKTKDRLSVEESREMLDGVKQIFVDNNVDNYHLLGRAYFQDELIKIQAKEIAISSVISIILVAIILFLLFRKVTGVLIALTSIGVSLLIFMGLMGATGRELSIMSALYPVLLLIVGTSDVVHIMSKYLDELQKGRVKAEAMRTTIREIGFATFLTSLTTAVGFATLLTSRLQPVREFGVNSAIGVMITFVVTLLLSTAILSFFTKEQIMEEREGKGFWNKWIAKAYQTTLSKPKSIVVTSLIIAGVCLYGISQVTTNYRLEGNLPRGAKITDDFNYFEDNYSGFRPLEFAILVQDGYQADDYEVVKEVSKIEDKLYKTDVINSIISQATLYKSIERMNSGNQASAYTFPETKEDFLKSKRLVSRLSGEEVAVLINRDNDKTRISSRIADIGADSIKQLGVVLDKWIDNNVDSSIVKVRRTGTGLIVDKNAVYVTESLIYGLGLALIIISVLMAFLLKDWKMTIIAFIPNIIPVIFAAALLGYFNIELEAGVSIIFAVIFGIAVDDTIHFLSKFKLCKMQGMDLEQSIQTTFTETGKAIVFTSVILFFGFLVMLFSSNPPTQTVGLLISITLISAVLADLYLLPVIMRNWLK